MSRVWGQMKHEMAAVTHKGDCRSLSREEIDELISQGAFTPLDQIPASHEMTRVSTPQGFLEFIR
ncbi:MAG: hypothetical protein AB9919_06760 [Geobacteraceae bacterium]